MSTRQDRDAASEFAEAVRDAASGGRTLNLRGSGSKAFLGYPAAVDAVDLDLTTHTGVLQYEPGELVIRARGGTTLTEINKLLAEQGQMLPFEPPQFAEGATLGGAVAAGLSGPARPYRGALRDALLGVQLINGLGEMVTFGGQVMKNVAGYDITRLMAGSMGTLAVILDVSIRVCPLGETELTVVEECSIEQALHRMRALASSSYPVSGSCFDGTRLLIRLTGTENAVTSAARALGGEVIEENREWWRQLRDHELPFFRFAEDLWRVALPSVQPPGASAEWLLEWGGALRWCRAQAGFDLRASTAATGADHVQLFRAANRSTLGSGPALNHPLSPPLMELQRRIKHSFDPHGVFNRGRICEGW